jgi:hypothetical protein
MGRRSSFEYRGGDESEDFPEVQVLVERYGGWWNIPRQAWDEHDRRFKALRERLNALHKPINRGK